MFAISQGTIDPAELGRQLADPRCGGFASFEGWVRNHQDGRAVALLEYEIYHPLALSEGEQVLAEARERFDILQIGAVHAEGRLAIGALAVWVGVAAAHRAAAFDACRYAIDQIKLRLPIWKKEHYVNGIAQWVNCAACADPNHPHP